MRRSTRGVGSRYAFTADTSSDLLEPCSELCPAVGESPVVSRRRSSAPGRWLESNRKGRIVRSRGGLPGQACRDWAVLRSRWRSRVDRRRPILGAAFVFIWVSSPASDLRRPDRGRAIGARVARSRGCNIRPNAIARGDGPRSRMRSDERCSMSRSTYAQLCSFLNPSFVLTFRSPHEPSAKSAP